jgi:leucyl-tRNA synthetase
MAKFDHKKIEKKWTKKWEKDGTYKIDLDKAGKPFFNLMMFPYPSAEGLHVGNMYAFTHSDAYGRFMRMRGYDVFEPIGLDGFGIHSENYAIKIKEHIRDVSARTEKHFYDQLHMIGNGYDWSKTVETYKPEYYKWTQWFFLKMWEKGLAYRKKAPVNWCPGCKTVLSDEQVISGECERCGTATEKRQTEQWFWRITDYAERLLKNLDWIDWSEEVKTGQRNWIGKSAGAMVHFKIKDSDEILGVFTTRPDTLFGCTYMAVCPEHEILKNQKSKIKNQKEIENYIEETKKKSALERTDLNKDKTGVKIEGLFAINPVNNKEIPIFVADYVLPDYGTGAVMAVPAHDERDWSFAKKYNLNFIEVVKGGDINSGAFIGDGINVNSGFLDGLKTPDAKKKIAQWLEEKGLGNAEINYRLRDWCVSRQRYWGPPIPMIDCPECGWVPVPEKDLPVMLPDVDDFLPDGSGKGPLNKIKEFVNTKCPKCGGDAKRETDVSDPFVDSSWYYMRYLCTDFSDKALDKNRLKKWMPVDMYIGGKEHTVLHLLYSRFVTMVMHELGFSPEEEPFKKFRAHGLLIKEGAKISKSKGNIINPDEYIEKVGADAMRLYLLFLGDMRQGGDWRDTGIIGMNRFVNRVWILSENVLKNGIEKTEDAGILRDMHKTIKRVTDDLDKLKFNTPIAFIMEYVNSLQEKLLSGASVGKDALSVLIKLLAPFAPFVSEEIWEKISAGDSGSVHLSGWPDYEESFIKENNVVVPVQINGKIRATLEMVRGASEKEILDAALKNENIIKHLKGAKPSRVVYVGEKMLNIVV